jgi:alcohol dehydrogenase class IV
MVRAAYIPAHWPSGVGAGNTPVVILDALAEQAFDDQCTVCNPRYPLDCRIERTVPQGVLRGEACLA